MSARARRLVGRCAKVAHIARVERLWDRLRMLGGCETVAVVA
jgi:hypothetical protein